MKIQNLEQFEEFLKARIPSREALFMGDIGLKRSQYFMKLLGNPQNKLKVLHIAGTSGKGSTAYLTSHILESQGFKVGLSISPHVFDIRERMQVFHPTIVSRTRTTNAGHTNSFLDEKLILKYFHQILPAIKKMEDCKYGMPTFFEINVGLAYYIFHKENVDYAIMETGFGGTLDATNTVTAKNKICIITRIGLDHTEILGKTISKIAEQKAGIIQKNNLVISHQSSVTSKKVIKKKCEEKSASLFFINNKNYNVISSTPHETVFDFSFSNVIPAKAGIQPTLKSSIRNIKVSEIKSGLIPVQARNDMKDSFILKNIKLRLIGKHQAENCSLALSCLAIISERDDFNVNGIALREKLEKVTIPGRMEILKIGKQTLIIDGAHNPQKMEVFTNDLANIYPAQKFTFVVAFKKGKDFERMLKSIIPLADKILLAEFSTSNQDNHLSSTDNKTVSQFLLSKNFQNFEIMENKHSHILENVRMSKNPVVITGSLYFIGAIYKYIK